MTKEAQWTPFDEAMAHAQTKLDSVFKKIRDDAFHAGFQAGTQTGLRTVMPVAAQAMRESAHMWPEFPKELVLKFADIMEREMTEHLAGMIPNCADKGETHEQKQA